MRANAGRSNGASRPLPRGARGDRAKPEVQGPERNRAEFIL
jgi:hypothetical protein